MRPTCYSRALAILGTSRANFRGPVTLARPVPHAGIHKRPALVEVFPLLMPPRPAIFFQAVLLLLHGVLVSAPTDAYYIHNTQTQYRFIATQSAACV